MLAGGVHRTLEPARTGALSARCPVLWLTRITRRHTANLRRSLLHPGTGEEPASQASTVDSINQARFSDGPPNVLGGLALEVAKKPTRVPLDLVVSGNRFPIRNDSIKGIFFRVTDVTSLAPRVP